MRRKRDRSTEPKLHHNVYVILLSTAVRKELSIFRLNPKRDPAKPCVYVGMTGLQVDHRFQNHKNGYKAARLVRKYGVRLMPELYAHLNPMPFEAAAQMEKDLAEDLRNEGYTVAGGT
jgi:predicted GIY-YIG superfamily endonuclease